MSVTSSISGMEKDRDSLWYFTSEQLANSPSRRYGIDSDQELSYRQMTAYLIQEMGQRLQVSQLCINTAIVYMHRFYAFHSFTHFHRNGIAAASLFLAAKVEEQPRKLEHVIKAANKCLNQPTSSTTDTYYSEQAQDLVFNENVLLQTLGFDVAIDHPHTHVVKTCQLVKACKDLAQTSYFLASNSLHLTSMCLQYKPTVVACFCIYLACKWSRWEIPQSTEGKHWFYYVDKSVTMDLLKQLTDEFIGIYEKSPARLKSKLNTIKAIAQGAGSRGVNKDKKSSQDDYKMAEMMKMYHSCDSNSSGGMHTGQYAHNPVEISSQNISQPLLPPPQIRKLDTHSSSQMRNHSNSSHHSKAIYNSADVIPELKVSHKQSFNGNMAARSREHSQSHQQVSTNITRTNVHGTNNRSSSSNIGIQPPPRSSLQSHHNELAAQKFRERSSNSLNLQNSSCHVNQKVIPKLDVSRSSTKEPLTKVPENNKQGIIKPIHPNSNLILSQFSNVQVPPCPQAATKIEPVTDVLRNNGQSQRSYLGNNGRSNPIPPALQQQIDRTSHALYNVKPEQQKSSQLFPNHLKQFASTDGNFLANNSETALHAQAHNHGIPEYIGIRSDTLHPEEQNHPNFAAFSQVAQQKDRHLFSPEWQSSNQEQTSDNFSKLNTETFMKGLANIKESPKKNDSEHIYEGPSKREKVKNVHLSLDINKGFSQQLQQSNQPPKSFSAKKEYLLLENEQASTSTGIVTSSLKRPIETLSKYEEPCLQNTKIRKLETNISSVQADKTLGDINKHHVINGIETNPDLVKHLLKESLCTPNFNILNETISTSNNSHTTTNTNIVPDSNVTDSGQKHESSRSEKKKKKEKHKHKEKDKDKPKDKEERKKHKKDKDKHKDRDRESGELEHVKIKITKEKLENTHGNVEQPIFKIKIPKDRITGDVNLNNTNQINNTPALKIKISKDKLENYTSGTTAHVNYSEHNTHNTNPSYLSYMPHHHTKSNSHSSNKKKDRDRDRDREKEKKRNNHDHQRSHSNSTSAGTFKSQHQNK